MRLTLKNTIGSPYDIQTTSGPAILPAFGEFTGDFSDEDAAAFKLSGMVIVSEPSDKPKKKKPD